MYTVIFDSQAAHDNLLPLTFTRPVGRLRVGIDTIADKWEYYLKSDIVSLPVSYLQPKFGDDFNSNDALYVSGDVLPNEELAAAVKKLNRGELLTDAEGVCIAFRGSRADFDNCSAASQEVFSGDFDRLKYTFDIFRLNGKYIDTDYRRLTAGRKSQPLSKTNTIIGPTKLADGSPAIFIEPGASVEGATLNLKNGPIYIGVNAEVMEGSCLRGPIALCLHGHINMGAKIYGDTTIGPYCKVGGEVNNVVMIGFSNKSHDGYLGNAVIGEWCNIGAGVNASNLKNDYSKIRLWNYATGSFMRTDLQFCGLIMGDHSKIGISVMLNTATVIGVGVNLHGAGFPRTFIPSFTQGSPTGGFKDVPLKSFCDIAERVMQRRGVKLSEADRSMFEAVRIVATGYK